MIPKKQPYELSKNERKSIAKMMIEQACNTPGVKAEHYKPSLNRFTASPASAVGQTLNSTFVGATHNKDKMVGFEITHL